MRKNRYALTILRGSRNRSRYREAGPWFRKAADQGYAPAQLKIAVLLMRGKGVRRDRRAGMTYLTKAAYQGYPAALIQMYSETRFELRDNVEAYAWLVLAVECNREWSDIKRRFDKEFPRAVRSAGKERADELRKKVAKWRGP